MQIKLYISARNLKNLDTFTKSDPKCILYEYVNNSWKVVGKTEGIKNNLNPDWVTAIDVAFFSRKCKS